MNYETIGSILEAHQAWLGKLNDYLKIQAVQEGGITIKSPFNKRTIREITDKPEFSFLTINDQMAYSKCNGNFRVLHEPTGEFVMFRPTLLGYILVAYQIKGEYTHSEDVNGFPYCLMQSD